MSAWASPERTTATAAAAIASPSRVPDGEVVEVDLARLGELPDRGSGPTRIGRTQPLVAGDPHGFQHGRIITAGHGDGRRGRSLIGVVVEAFESVDWHSDSSLRLRLP